MPWCGFPPRVTQQVVASDPILRLKSWLRFCEIMLFDACFSMGGQPKGQSLNQAWAACLFPSYSAGFPEEFSGRCGFVDSEFLHKRELQVVEEVLFSERFAEWSWTVQACPPPNLLTYRWPQPSFLIQLFCSQVLSVQAAAHHSLTSGVFTHSTHEISSKGGTRKELFGE